MTETMANMELNKFMANDLPEAKEGNKNRPLLIGAILAVVLLAICYFVASSFIDSREEELLSDLQVRQEIAVEGRANVLSTWLDETATRANPITGSPLFQLFTAEVNNAGSDNLPKALRDQLPYMQNAITSFIQENELIGAYLVGSDGRAYLASAGAPPLTNEQRERAQAQYEGTDVIVSALQPTAEGLMLDFYIPVFAPQSANGDKSKVTGVMVMMVPATDAVAAVLKPSRFDADGQVHNLYQQVDGKYYKITPNRAPFIAEQASEIAGTEFASRPLGRLGDQYFSTGTVVDRTNWVVMQGIPKESALSELETYKYSIYGLSGSFFIVVISIISGIWLSLKSQNAKAMADQYKGLAQQINAQRRLLGSINGTIDDLIGLTDGQGFYVYANPALARFTDFPEAAIPGKTDRDLFGDQAARKLDEMNQQVMVSGQTVNDIFEITTSNGERIVRVEKSRLMDDDGAFMGIVTVIGDITEFMTYQRQKEEQGRKTISILVKMMEGNDPYLAGHSQRMGELSNSVAKLLEIPREERQNIATAANLSQVGKISIPAEIRTKESRLTDEEMAIMQQHVSRAGDLLHEMEIDENVITAVTQMYERQDGSGYPHQLQGNEIKLSARILGMADILVARVSPRSYREAISIETAMEVFRTNPEKYDSAVVEAFDAFLKTEDGQLLKDSLEGANG
ncbi:MAG: PAS domain-containing protein [Sneathiella sp.]|nr:PAS domain-containing protein [Sneathiella sp.]